MQRHVSCLAGCVAFFCSKQGDAGRRRRGIINAAPPLRLRPAPPAGLTVIVQSLVEEGREGKRSHPPLRVVELCDQACEVGSSCREEVATPGKPPTDTQSVARNGYHHASSDNAL